MAKKNFISLLDFSQEELVEILDRADRLASLWHKNKMPRSLQDKKAGLWFYGNGFRNRTAFEIGARAMGASVSYIPGEPGINEPLEDIGHYLKNWFDFLILRAKRHDDLLYLSETLPVINARTNLSHPCEIMGDLQFIRKQRGSIEELKMVFVGEVTNLCLSWFEAAVRFPIEVIQIAPVEYQADQRFLDTLNEKARGFIWTSGNMSLIDDSVDLIYTDCRPKADSPKEKKNIDELFMSYQITKEHVDNIKEKGMFLPCPPVSRGEEVSAEAVQSEKCLNYQAKEYLLHSQNAIMELMI